MLYYTDGFNRSIKMCGAAELLRMEKENYSFLGLDIGEYYNLLYENRGV